MQRIGKSICDYRKVNKVCDLEQDLKNEIDTYERTAVDDEWIKVVT